MQEEASKQLKKAGIPELDDDALPSSAAQKMMKLDLNIQRGVFITNTTNTIPLFEIL